MRKFPLSIILLAIALSPFSLHAAWGRSNKDFKTPTAEELALTAVPFAPGAPAVILEWIARHDDDESISSEHVRIKILTAEGKKYGDVELTYVPGYSSLGGIRARVIKPDGTAVPFKGEMYDKLVIRSGGYKVMQKTFSLPDVQPGSIVEYRFDRTWPVTDLRTNHWLLQRELPILATQIWVRPYSGDISSFFITRGLSQEQMPKKVGDHFEVELKNMPAFEDEPFSPPDEELKPRVEFFYTVGRPDLEKYWTDTGRDWTEAIERFIGKRSGIEKKAQAIIAGATTSDEKLQRLYARVQELRNLSYEKDKTEQETRREKLKNSTHVEHVLDEGYGYRNELNRLFVALARGAGFTANIVCTSQRDGMFFSKQMPDRNQIESEIALVQVDGQDRFFDPGTPHTPYGILPWENTSTAGLKLEKKTTGTWLTTVEQPVGAATIKRKAQLELDGDLLKGKVVVTFGGQEAMWRRVRAHNDDEATAKKAIEDDAKEWFPDGSTIKLAKLSDLKGSHETLVAEFDVEIANIGTTAGSRTLIPLAVFSATRKNPFSAEQRKHPVYFRYPHETQDDVTLKLPEGFAIESVPQPQTIDLGGAGYTTTWAKGTGDVTLTRKTFVKSLLIPVENYRALRSYYSRVANGDQESLVLKKGAQ